jgi:glycosyltransferase involved in cell wall biosynthesis
MSQLAPQVSVIIPAYNAADFLAETIVSVQEQTFQNWELLVIDDGSRDRTAEVAQAHQQKDSRIRLIRQVNQGVSTARNHGVAESQGEIIGFLDADDQWLPTKLRTHLDHFQAKPKVGVSFAQVEILTQAGASTGQRSTSRLTGLNPEDFLSENPTTTTSNWVIRRAVWDAVGGFCPTMSYSEDLEWLLRMMCTQDWQIEGIPQVLTRYRTSSGGLSADLYQMEAGWNTLVTQAKTYGSDLVDRHFAKAQAIHLRYLARRAFRLQVDSSVGVDLITRSLRSHRALLWQEPRRTISTLLAVYGQHALAQIHRRYPRSKPSQSPD